MIKREQLLLCCDSLRDGDGISPRYEKKLEHTQYHDNPRLCRRAQKLGRLAIAELGLQHWDVDRVLQVPGKNTLSLIMKPLLPQSIVQREQTLEWLHDKQGEIRSRIAMGIYRKKAPALTFQLSEGGD